MKKKNLIEIEKFETAVVSEGVIESKLHLPDFIFFIFYSSSLAK
jgi:hypothetical protein